MTPKAGFAAGLRVGLPFSVVTVPFGMVVGVAATAAGFDPFQTGAFSVLVGAGAAQLAALQMMVEGTPLLVAVLTATAVNLRLAMYSASLAPHLGAAPLGARLWVAFFLVDQAYAASILAYERNPEWPIGARLGFFFGTVAPVMPVWVAASIAGAAVGNRLPADWPLDVFVPMTFIALIAPMLRTLAHWVAAAVSVVASLALAGLPWSLGLLAAGVIAMLAGAAVEALRERRS
jgi:predicted branched-subunit amino acid permease